jgi:hypothetical protein
MFNYSCTFIILILFGFLSISAEAADGSARSDSLAILWTSGDPEVAENVCLMYTGAAAKYEWFEHVVLIVWGPSARLLSETPELQTIVSDLLKDGVVAKACVVCANRYGVADSLTAMGIEVRPMGKPLTRYLKSGWSVLTF